MNGILVIDKPVGMTSHDVVFQLRKILKTRKIGHSGTLDPNATGVLLVLVGKATKTLPFLEDIDKEYIATLKLGTKTLTDDIWGDVQAQQPCVPIVDFAAVLHSFQGKQKQVPPLVSSIKVKGKKLYEYARTGEAVDLPIRDVEIYDIEMLDKESLKFRVHCSSGTYIRSLCVDIAKKTGNLGCMSSLVRTKVGRFSLADAQALASVSLENVKMYPIEHVLKHIKAVAYQPIEDVYHGKKICLEVESDRVCIMDNQQCIAIYERVCENQFKSVRGLW